MKVREGGVRKRKWCKERGDTDSDRVEEVGWRGKRNIRCKEKTMIFTPQCFHTDAISPAPSVTSDAHQFIRYQRGRTQRENTRDALGYLILKNPWRGMEHDVI